MGTIACRVELGNPSWDNKPCRLEARSLARERVIVWTVPVRQTVELPLPAGRWVVSVYIDLDEDGRYFKGSLSPFRAAEPRAVVADTLSIRARFTLEDVVVHLRP